MKKHKVSKAVFLRRCLVSSLLVGVPLAAMAQMESPAPMQATPAEMQAPATMSSRTTVPVRKALTIRQIYDHVEAAGYIDQSDIEWDKDGHYEVKARNAQGMLVKLEVDATTGKILSVRGK